MLKSRTKSSAMFLYHVPNKSQRVRPRYFKLPFDSIRHSGFTRYRVRKFSRTLIGWVVRFRVCFGYFRDNSIQSIRNRVGICSIDRIQNDSSVDHRVCVCLFISRTTWDVRSVKNISGLYAFHGFFPVLALFKQIPGFSLVVKKNAKFTTFSRFPGWLGTLYMPYVHQQVTFLFQSHFYQRKHYSNCVCAAEGRCAIITYKLLRDFWMPSYASGNWSSESRPSGYPWLLVNHVFIRNHFFCIYICIMGHKTAVPLCTFISWLFFSSKISTNSQTLY